MLEVAEEEVIRTLILEHDEKTQSMTVTSEEFVLLNAEVAIAPPP